MNKGSIVIKTGIYVSMRCGFPHIAPDASGIFFFLENAQTVKEIALEKGWHYSRKYGWLCDLKHNWRRVPKYAPVAQTG